MGKCIHYYKNVKSLFHHYAEDEAKGHWSFHAPESDGYFLSHFRVDFDVFLKKIFLGRYEKLILIMNMFFFCSKIIHHSAKFKTIFFKYFIFR